MESRRRTKDRPAALTAEHPDYPPIVIDGERPTEIWGVVVGCIRKIGQSVDGPPPLALDDCSNFHVSCERVFDRHFEGVPVLVLSNNDGCAIARSELTGSQLRRLKALDRIAIT